VRADDRHGEEDRVSGFWDVSGADNGQVGWTHGSMRKLRNPRRLSHRVSYGGISCCSTLVLNRETGIRGGVLGVLESLTPLRTPGVPMLGRYYTSG
jgi:hypothetical protein